jgi:TRAP-type C4-dicarboxylate transport system substrate-binding protein
MPRRPLSDEQKEKMQEARKSTSQEREAAFAILESNSQFTNPKFWERVSTEFQDEVLAALRKAQRALRKDEIARLKAKIEELELEA